MDNIENIRHSLAHLLSAAVKKIYKGAHNAIGPAVENGFYQDFDMGKFKVSEEDFPKIEQTMREILKTWNGFKTKKVSVAIVKKHFKDNPYKLELIKEFAKQGKTITENDPGGFLDLCKGGHVKNINEINPKTFKLIKIAGAYWRGDEKNKMLTRIYGVAFNTERELAEYLKMQEEAAKRDHKVLGQKLDLFIFSDLVGPGLPLFTPNGTILRDELDNYVWELRKSKGYKRVDIPHITKKELYETSGHWDKFKDELFRINTREKHEFALKPMNCPHHIQIFDRKKWSYRELPQKYASTTKIYRDEQTGELSGLSRVRSITQDDAHIFCNMARLEDILPETWEIIRDFYSAFSFPLKLRLSLRSKKEVKKYLGNPKLWEAAEKIIKDISKKINIPQYSAEGEAAFYGPKLDFMATDSLGREWQVATIQLDMVQPERFGLKFVNDEGGLSDIIMIHCAIMGSIERFMSILIEHYAGAFPLWLSPVQIAIIPISEKHLDYANKIAERFKIYDLRFKILDERETLGKKIRESEMEKIPYLLIVGDKEIESQKVSIRQRVKGDIGQMPLEKFIEKIKEEIKQRS